MKFPLQLVALAVVCVSVTLLIDSAKAEPRLKAMEQAVERARDAGDRLKKNIAKLSEGPSSTYRKESDASEKSRNDSETQDAEDVVEAAPERVSNGPSLNELIAIELANIKSNEAQAGAVGPADLVDVAPLEAIKGNEDISLIDNSPNYQTNDGDKEPVPYPDTGGADGDGKVDPGNADVDVEPEPVGSDPSTSGGVGKKKTGGGTVSSSSPDVKLEGKKLPHIPLFP